MIGRFVIPNGPAGAGNRLRYGGAVGGRDGNQGREMPVI